MTKASNSRILRTIPLLFAVFLLNILAHAQYSGGTGEPNDPYQIATAEDLILLGENPEYYDKHFILTDDIDLDPNLPGRKVFERAVFAAFTYSGRSGIQFTPFVGVFDGNGYTISNLTIEGMSHLGLFSQLGVGAKVTDLSLVDVSVSGSGEYIGGLAGSNGSYHSDGGLVTRCYSTGTVTGSRIVGGLVGDNFGSITSSYSTCTVRGGLFVGGLIGGNGVTDYPVSGILINCYSTGTVDGEEIVGGLAGYSHGNITTCYSSGVVTGNVDVGGLVGQNWGGSIICSYSTGVVSGDHYVGGLVGRNYYGAITNSYSNGMVIGNNEVGGLVGDIWESKITMSFWDMETSGQTTSAGGTGKTTAEMLTKSTYLEISWDFAGETTNGTEDIWKISEDLDYPLLWWEKYSGGTGEPNNPYQIATAEDLMLLGETPEDYDKHFIMIVDIDLDPNLPGRKVFDRAVIAPDMNDTDFYYDFQGIPFSGVFNGNDHTISHLTIEGISNLGLFGQLHEQAIVSNVGLIAVNVNGVYGVGAIVGNNFGGSIVDSFSNGLVNGNWFVGGLVGNNSVGSINGSCSTGVVTGKGDVGGLVGRNGDAERGFAVLSNCYSTATVSGSHRVGGLAGSNYYKGKIATSYSTGMVTGIGDVGGLVGHNFNDVTQSHSTATVSGDEVVGGFVGYNANGNITMSYSSSDVSGDWTAGGFVGYNYNGSIATSYSTGTVIGNWNVGGLVGINEESSINNCYSSSEVTGHGYIGGLVGHSVDSDIAMSYSSGLVTGNEDVGGLVAFNNGSIISSFWDMESSGQIISAGGENKTTSEMQTANTFLEAGWDFVEEIVNGPNDIWKISEGLDYPCLWWEKYGGGIGEPNNPYLIYTAEHLNEMSDEPNDWDKHFKLMADIDMSGYSYDKAVIAPHIGNQDLFKGIPFTGVFNGNGHTISHLTIDGSSLVSLFGLLESGAEVRDLGILDVNITGSGTEIGGLVAKNQGHVVNCYSTGSVSGDWCVGGLVGNNYGNITNCYSISKVIGNSVVGGLIGINNGVVIHCYSNNTVDGVWLVGGLIGSSSEMDVASCFWNIEISGKTTSAGGTGKTCNEMQTASNFLEAGWDFVGETTNGTEDIWWILEGQDYPRLWWEAQ